MELKYKLLKKRVRKQEEEYKVIKKDNLKLNKELSKYD